MASGFDYHVGAGDSLGVEPPVIASGHLKGQLLILIIVLSHIDVKAVGGKVVERPAGDPGLFPLAVMALDIPIFRQFLLDLDQILLVQGDIQSCADGL